MKELISIFQNNRNSIYEQLINKIKIFEINKIKSENLDAVFKHFDALETIYAVDENFLQLSPIFNRNSQNEKFVKKVKMSLKKNTYLDENEQFISSPYISDKTNKYVITLVKKFEDRIIAFDFDLYKLLIELSHTGIKSKIFLNIVKTIYGIIGACLTLFALILVFYSLYDFMNNFFKDSNIFHSIFKSTIGLTLGLAIFDLSKNLLEHEVIFKEHFNEEHGDNKLLVKFMISIIIALAIEALMTVFKIAISDYTEILYAVYLLGAIGFLLISMSQFNKHMYKEKVYFKKLEEKR